MLNTIRKIISSEKKVFVQTRAEILIDEMINENCKQCINIKKKLLKLVENSQHRVTSI